MARQVNRDEIWMYRFAASNKRLPVLVISLVDVIPLSNTVMVAPITSVIRGAPSEVVVGVDEGLKRPSAVNLDHIQTGEQGRLQHFVGTLFPVRMRRVCRAMAIAVGCDV